MKKHAVLAALVLVTALPLAADTWKDVALMDAGCATKKAAMAAPEKHTKSCAMQCAKAGYGAVVDGKFVKFDAKGNELATAALKKSHAKDHLRANVTGELKAGEIHVTALTMEK